MVTIVPSLGNATIGYAWGTPQYKKGSVIDDHYLVTKVRIVKDSNKLVVYELRRLK